MNRENQKRIFVLAVALVAIAALISVTPPARSDDEHATKVKEAAAQSAKAAKVFDAIMQAPDKSIPRDLLARAKAIAVFPQVIKASFVIGGEGGRCREPSHQCGLERSGVLPCWRRQRGMADRRIGHRFRSAVHER